MGKAQCSGLVQYHEKDGGRLSRLPGYGEREAWQRWILTGDEEEIERYRFQDGNGPVKEEKPCNCNFRTPVRVYRIGKQLGAGAAL